MFYDRLRKINDFVKGSVVTSFSVPDDCMIPSVDFFCMETQLFLRVTREKLLV